MDLGALVRLEMVYTALGLFEVFVLLASALALGWFVLRSICRALFAPKGPETKLPTEEDLRQLKRAGSGMSG